MQVRVLESAPQLGEVGAGISLSPNATHALWYLGLSESLTQLAGTPSRAGVRHFQSGDVLADLDRAAAEKQYGAPYLQMHRADLHGALLDALLACDSAVIELDQHVTAYEQRGGSVLANTSTGKQWQGRALIGCDGIRSAIRRQLAPSSHARFTGYVAWRGLVPVSSLPSGLIERASGVFIGPAGSFARYLIRSGSILNVAAFGERDEWTDEGWSIPAPVRELHDQFAGWHDEVQQIIAATPPSTLYKWGLFDHEPLSTWRDARVASVGRRRAPNAAFPRPGGGNGHRRRRGLSPRAG